MLAIWNWTTNGLERNQITTTTPTITITTTNGASRDCRLVFPSLGCYESVVFAAVVAVGVAFVAAVFHYKKWIYISYIVYACSYVCSTHGRTNFSTYVCFWGYIFKITEGQSNWAYNQLFNISLNQFYCCFIGCCIRVVINLYLRPQIH